MKKHGSIREEQIIYARCLNAGMKLSLIFLFITFTVYITGLLPVRITVSNLPVYWGLKANEFIQKTHMQSGWLNLYLMHKGDFWNFISLLFLGLISIVCYFRMMIYFLVKKNSLYVIITFLEILILLFAAFVGNTHSFVFD
jgi:uncharacterized membrane protein